eukprot:278591_1
MSKRHSRLIEYFITVGIDFESVAPINDDSISNPIRELRIISEKQIIPEGFECIKTTVTGKDASLTKRGMVMKNTKHYLCYSRESERDVFTRIQYNKAKSISREWYRAQGKIMNGKTEYCICTKNDSSVPPIADICIITVDGKESCPNGYVKLPATINGLAICFRHLPMDALGLRYQTCILDRYPRRDYANSPLSNTVAVFCQPNGADIRNEASMPTFLSFVLTDSEGRKMYAITVTFYDELEEDEEQCCIRSLDEIYTDGFRPNWPKDSKNNSLRLYHSKSVCILSYYPFFLSFREVLKELYRLANSPGKIPIERYIINLCEETPLPVPNKRCVELLYAHKPILFRIPNEDELPLLDSNIKKIFCCLSLNNTLLLFKCLITQKYKILFTSAHISLITEICEGLTSFLQPFEWQFTYVPVLPYSVFGILDAPVPVLVGMHASRIKPDYYSDPEREIIIVDLDNNSVHIPSQVELIETPTNVFKMLKSDLKLYAKANKVALFDKNTIQFVDSAFNVNLNMNELEYGFNDVDLFNATACRAAFYKFWIKTLGPSYQRYLKFPDDNDDVNGIEDIYDLDGFIQSRPKSIRKFWTQFSETQAFQKFIEDLTYESTEDRAVALRSFYKCCQHEHKEGDYDDPVYNTSNVVKARKKLSMGIYDSPKLGPQYSVFPFAVWLQDRVPNIESYQVPQANESQLNADYKYSVESSFPVLNETYFIAARKCNLMKLIQHKPEENKDEMDEFEAQTHRISKGSLALKEDGSGIKGRGRDRGKSKGSKSKKGRSLFKNQTPSDRAKFQLLQIYGTWFAAHVAALDFKDIPGDEVQSVVKSTLDVLYRMTDVNVSRDVMMVPDELIYKACLILCGKFGKKKEASKLFKDLKKNGITPSAKTYGAYTNAMASSGANMLLSAAGSTSSGASSLAGRTHRRSFAPTTDLSLAAKHRSLSAAVNPNAVSKRLHAPHKINTIREDDEADQIGAHNGGSSPFSEDEEEKASLVLNKIKSSPYVPSREDHPIDTIKEEPAPMTKPKSLDSSKLADHHHDAIPPLNEIRNVKSAHLLHPRHSNSTPTPSPKIEDDPPPFSPPDNDDDDDGIIRTVWQDDDDDEDEEAKESQPKHLNTPPQSTVSSSTYSTPSVLSSQISAASASSVSNTPEPQLNGHELQQCEEERVAIIIDYATLSIEAQHECKCGYVLSDAQIMVGWCSEFTASNKLRCIMCRQNAFAPKLHLRYNVTRMSLQGRGICSFETCDELIDYISPLQLRSKVNFILQHRRLDFEDPETFRTAHSDEFWNMIWYFYHRHFDLSFLLGEHDANALNLTIIRNEENAKRLSPQSDDELLIKLKPIYAKATSNPPQMRDAISDWLLNRSQTDSAIRNNSIWNLSVFDSFHDLAIPDSFKTYDAFVREFKNVCRILRPKIRDRAWDDPSLAIQKAFQHPRISNARLQQMAKQLSGKPLRPNVPVPVPPAKN